MRDGGGGNLGDVSSRINCGLSQGPRSVYGGCPIQGPKVEGSGLIEPL